MSHTDNLVPLMRMDGSACVAFSMISLYAPHGIHSRRNHGQTLKIQLNDNIDDFKSGI